MIAEDSVLLREGITRLLVDAGEDVVAGFGDADALLAALADDQPDLVVLDVRMPPTLHRRGRARRAADPRALARDRHPRALAVRGGALRHRADLR